MSGTNPSERERRFRDEFRDVVEDIGALWRHDEGPPVVYKAIAVILTPFSPAVAVYRMHNSRNNQDETGQR